MTRARLDGFLLLLLGSALFVLVGFVRERLSPLPLTDFKALYYSARSLLQNSDPYNPSELLRVYKAEGGDRPSDPAMHRRDVTLYVHPPTAFILTTPFAMLAWGPAHILWMILTAATFILAACLMWSLAADYAPVISGALICIFLFNSELLLEVGNAAGIAISLCVIAVWCFLRDRFVPLGILCLALSLAVKPHDASPVWLYFLLAGGVCRKRALQTLVLTIALCLPGIVWASHVAPNWMQELHANLATGSMRGEADDPGPATLDPRDHGAIIISLQSAISVFRDDPRIYNPASYLLCAPLLLIWALAALRKRFSQQSAWLALAAIAALSMLPLYHRLHDTRLLLLTLPAFAMLWAEGGTTAWLALLFTAAAVVVTGDIPVQLLGILSAHLRESIPGFAGQLLTLVLARPVPLMLLAMGIFYLWVYMRATSAPPAPTVAAGSEQ